MRARRRVPAEQPSYCSVSHPPPLFSCLHVPFELLSVCKLRWKHLFPRTLLVGFGPRPLCIFFLFLFLVKVFSQFSFPAPIQCFQVQSILFCFLSGPEQITKDFVLSTHSICFMTVLYRDIMQQGPLQINREPLCQSFSTKTDVS